MSSTPIRKAFKSQYHAALSTLQQTIENCPEHLWNDPQYPNPYWQIAYHALYFADLYLEQNLEAFHPWFNHRPDHQNMGKASQEITPYTKAEILDYCRYCLEKSGRALDMLDLDHPESGYPWYQMPKLEHQIVSIRHIQHHAAQLTDRLRNAAGIGSKWMKGV